MGKNLRQQRRGRGGKYKSPSHRYVGKISYTDFKSGKVVDISHAPGRSVPVATIAAENKRFLQIASKGIRIGQVIETDRPGEGNVLELGKIPEGSKVHNIELHPGDGGKICRSSGTSATLIGHEKGKSKILLPSKREKIFSSRCRATMGSVAAAGRIEKPFRKAGSRFHAMRVMGRLYPRVKGVAMNPVDHPFGGSAKPGKLKSVSRHMPSGKKVGSISPRRMGKRKRK